MSKNKQITIVVFGIGNVGSTLINQILEAKGVLLEKQNLEVKIPVIANSKYVFFDRAGMGKNWELDFEASSVPYSIEDVINHVNDWGYKNLIAIDATASKEFVEHYIPLVENGFNIVSANKVANTLDYAYYKALRETLKINNKTFLYETNVGAGLPVIETIKKLHESGEKIEKVRGVFSGSLSYIFNTFSKCDKLFSTVLTEASSLGLTEPDAREDLSGNDVARKLLILARELDINKELIDVKVEGLVPKNLNGKTTVHQFNKRLKELDNTFKHKKQDLQEGQVFRYVGELDVVSQNLEVKLVQEIKSSPLGQLQGADTVFEIFTESYKETPLVIQGAGAGKAVTARGVFSDVIKIAQHLN